MSFDEQMAAGGRVLRDEVALRIDVDAARAATLARRAGTDDTVDSRSRRSRVLVGVAAAALAGVAGVGLWAVSADREPGQIAPADSTSSTPDSTDPRTSVATTAVPDDVGELDGGLGVGFSAEAVFAALPSTVTTADGVVDGSEVRLWATAADLEMVEAVTGRTRSTAESVDEWLASIYGTGGVASGGVVLVPPEFPLATAVESTSQQRRDELGFDIVDTDRYATLGSFGLGFVGVYTGDGLTLADSFVDVGGGVVSLGTGDDFDRSVDEISPLRPFGQSLRATTTPDAIVLGWATPDVAAWRERGGRLIDDERLSVAAGVLDRHQLLDVNAVVMDFAATEGTRGDVTITERFEVLATGTAIDGDQLVTVISYVFADETAAAAMRPVIDDLWHRPAANGDGAPAELYVGLEVEAIGRTVTVTAPLAEGTTTNTWISYLAVGDAIFAHSAAPSAPVDDVPATTPQPDEPGTDDGQIAGLSAGAEWEFSGIWRSCSEEGSDFPTGCTQVVHDPSGVPISYDPSSRTLTRHVREDGRFVEAVLPEAYGDDVWLIAAGPDEVVYLNVTERPGAEGSADLVAVTLAPGDAGREIDRGAGQGNPGSDADFVVTPQGLVTTDWYGQGQRPAADRQLAMPWVDRDPDDGDSPEPGADPFPNGVDSITIDAYEHTVTVNGRTWQITGQASEFPPTGMPPIVRTFDGGFIARYDETANDYRSIVVRGWPDGSVDEWLVPGSGPGSLGWTVVPEPRGTVLIAHGDMFVRATPFEPSPPSWDGRLNVDVETGDVDVTPLNEHLATLDWTLPQPPWDIDPIAFANAAAGPLSSPAELRTVTLVEQDSDRSTVTVTDERFLDDSVYATRLTLTIATNLQRVDAIEWANSCQPRRGHQTFEAAYCT